MPAANRHLVGFAVTAYFLSDPLDDPTEANIEAALTDDNLIDETRDIGDLIGQRDIISVPEYGAERQAQVPGQIAASSIDIGVTLDLSNPIHTSIRDDDGKSNRGLILVYASNDSNKTYCYIDGRVAGNTESQPVDDVVQMTFTYTIAENPVWVDKT